MLGTPDTFFGTTWLVELEPNRMETDTVVREVQNELHWQEFTHHWLIRSDTIYLNHGSFGPSPECVRLARRQWIDQLDCQPMDFYVREFEKHVWNAREATASFVGTTPENLVFAENATAAMNVIARSFRLEPGEEILSNNHEYGAVHRIWERKCGETGAALKICRLPDRFESAEQIVDSIAESLTPQTRLVILSHITSATALVMPVKAIAHKLKSQGVALCIDGPHAPAQIELNLDEIHCDFYTASCHKWLCAPLGSGFLYVHPDRQQKIVPAVKSWGRLLPAVPEKWDEEFTWTGTRDPSAFLSIPAAIEFMNERVGLESFRQRSRYLATIAEQMLCEEFGTQPIGDRDQGWYASMAHVPLPNGDHSQLQLGLWKEYGIEVPVILFEDRWYIRISCHLYNNVKHLETLRFALRKFLV